MDGINTDSKLISQYERLLNLLRFDKGIDRGGLSRQLKLSMPTIYKAIDELSSIGIVNKSESNIEINPSYGILVGISIGSSLCKIVFVDSNFQVLDSANFEYYKTILRDKFFQSEYFKENDLKQQENYIYFRTPNSFSKLKEILNFAFEGLEVFVENNINILSIGISCTGIINNKTQTILNAHNLKFLDESTLESLIFPDKMSYFQSKGIEIFLIQNSDATVIAEKIFLNQNNPNYKEKKNIITLYLGVGIGAGIYLNGLYSGSNGYSGEIGHTKAPVYESEKDIQSAKENNLEITCTCGNDDCYDYKIRTYVFGKNKVDFCNQNSDMIRAFLMNHPDKAELFGKYLGNMVNTLTNLLNIDLIIFTGKFYKSMDLLYNSIVSIQDKNQLKFSRNDCKLLTSEYGALSPAVGAAIYSYHKKYGLELAWDY